MALFQFTINYFTHGTFQCKYIWVQKQTNIYSKIILLPSVNFKDTELTFVVVVAEHHSQHLALKSVPSVSKISHK